MKAFMRGAASRLKTIKHLRTLVMRRVQLQQQQIATVTKAGEAESLLLGELAAAAAERDALELELYVLRSDFQRAAVRNEELSRSLFTAENAAQAAASVTPHDLSIFYAKLASRMTLLSSEIRRLRQNACVDAGGATLYLDLLERALTGVLVEDVSIAARTTGEEYDSETRLIGRDWPRTAQTMITLARMRSLRVLVEQVLDDGIDGDLLEAGVGRGVACILMRGVLKARGKTDRTVWVADSFAGMPPPDTAEYPADGGDAHGTFDELRVARAEVEANFDRYALLDNQVHFLEGWFDRTLPAAPIAQLAILRLDVDMYSSTIQTLDALYKKVAPGGYVIVGDYVLQACRRAVEDFRQRERINDELSEIDGTAVFWRKSQR